MADLMKNPSYPSRQGLYDPAFEHDACGIGFIANIKGRKSNQMVRDALTILVNLDHRGGQGADPDTGDGAGILLQVPHGFLKRECAALDIDLPAPGRYGVGMLFLPQDPDERAACEKHLEKIVEDEGQKVLGWRTVPTDGSCLGVGSKQSEPFIRQIFIAGSPKVLDLLEQGDRQALEREMYVIRKRAENEIRHAGLPGGSSFYFSSLSTRTIVYKGMLTPAQLDLYYVELKDPALETSLALIHSRFSTNTFPSWERAHPNRYMIHNGEINTLRGNVNWMHARQGVVESDLFGEKLPSVMPIIDPDGSDSAMFDNCLEFLTLSGRSLPHSVMMMIPEPWAYHESMDDARKAMYEYNSCLMEPWDGPAAIVFTDGRYIGAALDRNGLRPARYYVTTDDRVILSSEVGVLDVLPETVTVKERLRPGRMLLVDTAAGRMVSDEELKQTAAQEKPYRKWLDENLLHLDNLAEASEQIAEEDGDIRVRQQSFGYTREDIVQVLEASLRQKTDPIGAMGNDIPLAVLSEKPKLLYDYFKELFAQVTNPPIDALREAVITDSGINIGPVGNLLKPEAGHCRQIRLAAPILSNQDLAKIRHISDPGFKSCTISILFDAAGGKQAMDAAIERICTEADRRIAEGCNLLILSDRGVNEENAPIPALLASASLHHHLIREGTRLKASLLLESGEPREVHHFSVLLGYGVSAINPYLALDSLTDMVRSGVLDEYDEDEARALYLKVSAKGVIKVLSKMGISTIQSYHGAQIFECIGINSDVVDRCFTWTPSRIGGLSMEDIQQEALLRHERAFSDKPGRDPTLDSGSDSHWRSDGEEHMYNPETIVNLQAACRLGDFGYFQRFTEAINGESQKRRTLRGMLQFSKRESIPIEEVESVESIMTRFKTGAMSYGSISKEAHEAMAIAMNRIGGKSNTGEGGEDPVRFIPEANGDSKRSSIKQVASGRFGVTSHYLVNADEIQIKMAQGAKPGEGGQLPGAKVYPWIAKVRGTTAGVGLISPPPHHDIYSIEDLAELIHDLKNANDQARISVKLVSEVGVGTIAAGVAKARADVVLISGYDGGTGAAPRTGIRHAGLPWELGLAETHQTLVLNHLRDRIAVETDGKLLTGRDVVMATLLGAEEYGFATGPLVALGCVMMRVCNLDTCPVGVATQNPELRKNFTGKPEYVVNFMRFIAQEVRAYMAELGFRSINEMVGRVDILEADEAVRHWKSKNVDLAPLLYKPEAPETCATYCCRKQDHGLEKSLDRRELLAMCRRALDRGDRVVGSVEVHNTNRVVGTILGSEISRKYGAEGLPDDTIVLNLTGSAGPSFGAFVPHGVTLNLAGDANDYFGKGPSGGRLIVQPPVGSTFAAEDNVITGNVSLYGATAGEAYIRGVAGERFCVRNSGVHAVVEGVGDHACEYMTGGRVVVLGRTGRNFGAGMSGGVAYVLDSDGSFPGHVNQDMVLIEKVKDPAEFDIVHSMVEEHVRRTNSPVGKDLLDNWADHSTRFVKIIPKDYKRMLESIAQAEAEGHIDEAAVMAAFLANRADRARVGGN